MSDLLRAKAAFAVGVVVVPAGAIVSADDPIVSGRESLFVPVAPTFTSPTVAASAPVVEQATAAPGEKRATTRRTKKV